jgi:hydrogenase-4 component F
MFVAVTANNILLLWIAVEATTLCSAFLVNFFDRPAAIEAAWKYMIINTIALLLGLFGIFLFIAALQHASLATVSLDWTSIRTIAPFLDVALVKLAFVFMLIGYGTKAGLAPLHNWLPDAHSQAPSPVSALLSGALLNVALLALLRFKGVVDIAVGPSYTEMLFLTFGTASILIAAMLILIQKQYKRLLAYSSVEHMGIIVFGFGVGGVASVAALLHALYHSLAKSMLFLSSGNIALHYHALEIGKVRGLLRTLPLTGILFFAGLLAVAGVPPFGTFMTEFVIFSSAFASHPFLTTIALLALAVAFVGIMRHVSAMCFGERAPGAAQEEGDMLGILPIVALFALLLLLSIVQPTILLTLLQEAALNL